MLVTTPAIDNFDGRHLPGHCAHYTAPSHVSLFTTKAMRILLEDHSFSPVQFATDPAGSSVPTIVRSLFYSVDYAARDTIATPATCSTGRTHWGAGSASATHATRASDA